MVKQGKMRSNERWIETYYNNADLPLIFNVSLNENGSCTYNLNGGANKTFLVSGNYFVSNENGLSDGNY